MTTNVYLVPPTKAASALSAAVSGLVDKLQRLPAGPRRLVAESDLEAIEQAICDLDAELGGTLNQAKKAEPRKAKTQ